MAIRSPASALVVDRGPLRDSTVLWFVSVLFVLLLFICMPALFVLAAVVVFTMAAPAEREAGEVWKKGRPVGERGMVTLPPSPPLSPPLSLSVVNLKEVSCCPCCSCLGCWPMCVAVLLWCSGTGDANNELPKLNPGVVGC